MRKNTCAEDALVGLFDTSGRWHASERPSNRANPQGSMREGQFWQVFEPCPDPLPGNLARVFMMREYIQPESDEICTTDGNSVSKLNVLMYRARMRLLVVRMKTPMGPTNSDSVTA